MVDREVAFMDASGMPSVLSDIRSIVESGKLESSLLQTFLECASEADRNQTERESLPKKFQRPSDAQLLTEMPDPLRGERPSRALALDMGAIWLFDHDLVTGYFMQGVRFQPRSGSYKMHSSSPGFSTFENAGLQSCFRTKAIDEAASWYAKYLRTTAAGRCVQKYDEHMTTGMHTAGLAALRKYCCAR